LLPPGLFLVGVLTLNLSALGQVKITYLANEGFLLSSEEEKVLVDALFDGIRHSPRPPREQQVYSNRHVRPTTMLT